MDNEDFVRALYEVVLGRGPDHDGRAAHLADLERGVDPKEVFRRFVESDEYAAKTRPGVADAGTSAAFAREPQAAILEALALLAPDDVVGRRRVRVGRDHDGGYVMVDDFAGIAAAYSLGISDDVSWDGQMARLGLDVFQYDHAIPRLPEADARFRWRRRKIVGTLSGDPSEMTLLQAFGENGHTDEKDYILKIDVEGEEWNILSAIEPDFLHVFRQIVCELHGLGDLSDRVRRARMRQALVKLTAHHRVVHVHGNNCAPWALVGGVSLPDVLEVSLARADDYAFRPATGTFPTDLDRPNDPARADFRLGHFRFGRP